MELSFTGGIAHRLIEHEMLDVGGRDQHPLGAGEADGLADVEEPLDLLVGPADGLDDAPLVDGPGHRDALVDGDPRQVAQQREDLGDGSRTSVRRRVL